MVYGLTTGFGKFCDTYISGEDVKALQLNLIRSHACGIGAPFSIEIARAIMLLRVNALALGYSGIRPEVVQLMVGMLNHGVTPVIPEKARSAQAAIWRRCPIWRSCWSAREKLIIRARECRAARRCSLPVSFPSR